jgi:tropomyosin 2
MRIESFNKFQGLQQESAEREAQLLEKLRELRALHSASAGREAVIQSDLAQALRACERETLRADKLEHTMNLQSAYILQHEQEIDQLQQQCEALLAGKDEMAAQHRLQLQESSKLMEEKDRAIAQARQDAESCRLQLQRNQQQFDKVQQQQKEEVESIKLEYAAAEERRLQYLRTQVMGRVVKRLGNMALARAFGSWADCMHKAKEQRLAVSLTEMQSGMSMKDTLLLQQQQQQQALQQRLQGTQEEVESIKLEYAAAEERRLQYLRTQVMGRVVKRLGNMALARAFGSWAQRVRDSREEILVSALTEMQSGMSTKDTLLLQQQQQQQALQQRLQGTQEEVESIKLEYAAAEERRLQYLRTQVMGRVVKRLGNMALARAFGSWAQRVRDSREEILVSALTEMQSGMSTKDTLLLQQQQQQQALQQRLQGTQEEVESIKMEFADVFDATEQLQQIISKARIERADMLELISLLETCLQDKTAELHQQQLLLQDSQNRAQRLDEVLQQNSQEYEQLLQLSAEQIESLKRELADRMQQASAQELEAAQRSLQLRDEVPPHEQALNHVVESSTCDRVQEMPFTFATMQLREHRVNPASNWRAHHAQSSWQRGDPSLAAYADVETPQHAPARVQSSVSDGYNESYTSSDDGILSPVNIIVRTHERLPMPRATSAAQRHQPWDSSLKPQSSSGNAMPATQRLCISCCSRFVYRHEVDSASNTWGGGISCTVNATKSGFTDSSKCSGCTLPALRCCSMSHLSAG